MKLLPSMLAAAALAAFSIAGHAADAAAAPPDLARGQQVFTTTCAACHGADGNSAIAMYPKLAQQVPEYLIKQLTDFKSGKRVNAIMQGMAATLSDADMRNVAYWLASQKDKPGFATDKDLVATGEHLYLGGAMNRHIPACAGCHSPNGAGIPAQYPRLAGQQEPYTAAQLTAFRDGTRTNSPVMPQVTAYLTDHEIKALADYIAGLH